MHAVSCAVPAGVTAGVVLEKAEMAQITESGRPVCAAPGIVRAQQSGENVMIELGSGKYSFEWKQ